VRQNSNGKEAKETAWAVDRQKETHRNSVRILFSYSVCLSLAPFCSEWTKLEFKAKDKNQAPWGVMPELVFNLPSGCSCLKLFGLKAILKGVLHPFLGVKAVSRFGLGGRRKRMLNLKPQVFMKGRQMY